MAEGARAIKAGGNVTGERRRVEAPIMEGYTIRIEAYRQSSTTDRRQPVLDLQSSLQICSLLMRGAHPSLISSAQRSRIEYRGRFQEGSHYAVFTYSSPLSSPSCRP